MHNTSNSPCAEFFGNLSVLQHGSTFLLNFNDNIAFESRHLCLLVDFNFPKTDWSTVTSSYARKTSYLNNLDYCELCSAFLSFTHRGGNPSTTFSFPHLLQDFLTASCSHSLRSQIMLPYQQRFTPNTHHPFLGIRNYALSNQALSLSAHYGKVTPSMTVLLRKKLPISTIICVIVSDGQLSKAA